MRSYHFFLIGIFGIFIVSIALYIRVIVSPTQTPHKTNNAYLKVYNNAITHARKKIALGSLVPTSFSLGKRKQLEQYLIGLLSIFLDSTWAKRFVTQNGLYSELRPINLSEAVVKRKLGKRDPGGIVEIEPIIKNSHEKKHALVIGINAYPTMPLEAAVADAIAVSQRLKELNFEVKTLINHEAKKYAIESELGRLAHTKEDEQVLIYFAGHGATEHLHNNQLEGYLLPVDVDLRNLYATAISMRQLRELTRRIPAKHILYVFDSCYSGLGLTRAATTYTSEYLATLADKRAVYMITAGKEGEVAREIGQHGIFTLNFLDGIAGAADTNPKDEVVQASELGAYLARVVSRETKNEQNPQHGLLEGNGDFLFPLQDDDPIRLKESQLAKLKSQTNLQTEFDEITKRLKLSEEELKKEVEKIKKLDEHIERKEAKLTALSNNLEALVDLNRSPYSMMRFLNTGVEFNILKTFPNLKKAEEYYSRVFGMEVDLDKMGYQKDDKRKILLSRVPVRLFNAKARFRNEKLFARGQQVGLSGTIDLVIIQTETISDVLKEIKHISSPLQNDHTTFVKSIHLIMDKIDQKPFTFDQIKTRLIARYGNPTSTIKGTLKIIDWNTGQFQPVDKFIWENNEAGLLLRAVTDKSYFDRGVDKSLVKENIKTLEEYNEWEISTAAISIYLQNHSSILKLLYKQVYKIAELEEIFIEKKANLENLNF